MSINIKRKTVNIIIAVVIIAVVIAVGIFVTNTVITNMKINDIEQKLSAINSEELQNKIEEELQNTELYMEMNISSNNMYVGSMINEGVEFEGYICLSILGFRGNANNLLGAVEVPCFKITSDSNGKFKNIEYTDFLFNETQDIKEVVEKVFENDYGIDLEEINKNTNIREKFYKEKSYEYTNKGNVYVDGDNFFIAVLNKVANMNIEYGENIEQFKEYKTKTFGLEF